MLRGGLRPKHPYPVLGQNPFARPFPFVTIVYFVFKDFPEIPAPTRSEKSPGHRSPFAPSPL